MTYIAKAMNKTTRLDAGSAHEGAEASGGKPNVVPVTPEASLPVEYVDPDRIGNVPPDKDGRRAAMAVSGLGRRVRPEASISDFSALGTLESLPPETSEHQAPRASRSWRSQPGVIAGAALGLGALLLGFLFAPGMDGEHENAPLPELQSAPEAGAASGTGAESSAGAGAGALEIKSSGASGATRPVVVRVQIDGGNDGRVEFEGPSAPALVPATPVPTSELPEMPAYFEPLQPLELPPPPVMDPEEEEETIDSRYAAPPVEVDEDSIDDYRLEGIFWDEENPGAIINDTIVERGKRMGSLRVIEIHKTYVTVEFEGRTYDLR